MLAAFLFCSSAAFLPHAGEAAIAGVSGGTPDAPWRVTVAVAAGGLAAVTASLCFASGALGARLEVGLMRAIARDRTRRDLGDASERELSVRWTDPCGTG